MTMITESRASNRPLPSTGILASVARYIVSYRRNRRTLQDLSVMEDYMLRDIGLSRSAVKQASAAEFGADRMAILNLARSRGMGR